MKHIGNPIVCDSIYGDGKPVFLSTIKRKFKLSKAADEERPLLNRLALHSHRLHFTDQFGNAHQLEAPIAKDLRALIVQLEKNTR